MRRWRWLALFCALLLLCCSFHNDEPVADGASPSSGAGPMIVHAGSALVAGGENACGNAGVAPRIVSNTLMSPRSLNADGSPPANWNPLGGRITRGSIHYVSGDGLRFELETDGCTFISEIRVGNQVVTTTNSGGYSYSVQPSTTPPAQGNSRYNLWIFYPLATDGQSETVKISVGRVGGSAVTALSVPIVHVQSVEANGVNAGASWSRTDIFNRFSRSLYEKFNREVNSTLVTDADGDEHRIYGYQPSSLQISTLQSGIGFSFKYKVDINNWCNPTVVAHGKFTLRASYGGSGMTVHWIDEPDSNVQWPTGCELLETVPILGFIAITVNNLAADSIAEGLKASMMEELEQIFPSSALAAFFMSGVSHAADLVTVMFSFQTPSLQIHVPYDAFDMDRGGLVASPDERFALFASELGMSDSNYSSQPSSSARSGPLGIPLHSALDFPMHYAVNRSQPLVWGAAQPGQVLARSSNGILSTILRYAPGCVARAKSPALGTPSIRFGVNDSVADAQQRRALGAAPGFTLRLLFANFLGGDGVLDPCPEVSPTKN